MKRLTGALLFFAVFSAIPLSADPVEVVVLHSYGNSFPWTRGFQDGLNAARAEHSEINYHIEYLEAAALGNSMTGQQWVEYLKLKYRTVGVDAVIGDSGAAASLLYGYPEIFGEIPQVIYTPVKHETKDYQLSLYPKIETAVTQTVRIALRQNPSAGKAIIINGGNPATAATLEYLYSALEKSGVAAETVSGFTIPELKKKIKNCDSDSIIFYTLVMNDSTGARFVPKQVLEEVSDISPAPVYSFWGTLMDSGIAGGTMIDARTAAYEAVSAVIHYIAAGEFGDDYGTIQTYTDWEALKRYGISPGTIPADAVVINKPEPFLVRYYVETATAASLILLAGFIVVLVLLRRNLSYSRQLDAKRMDLQDALEEKSVLYIEMNNRIKNNLTLLSSMVLLQIGELGEGASREHLENVFGRLQALALIHEELSNNEQIIKSSINDYLRSLIMEVFNTMTAESDNLHLEIDIADVRMENKTAVACGLIINELLINAIKYAFPDNISGKISISLSETDDNIVELSVSDSGVGLPSYFNLESDVKLGLKIVKSLVEQLGGSLDIHSNTGVFFFIRFSI